MTVENSERLLYNSDEEEGDKLLKNQCSDDDMDSTYCTTGKFNFLAF